MVITQTANARDQHHKNAWLFFVSMMMGLWGCSPPSASPRGESASSTPTNALTHSVAPSSSHQEEAKQKDDSGAESAATTAAPTDTASAAAPTQAPLEPPKAAELPKVKVANIGMHIGGGPNDTITKAPIKQSVEPHFDDFRQCFALVDDPKKGGDFGVDLRIEKDGGIAKVEKPRTAIKGKGFEECMVSAFERIEFLKPKGGKTVVSYSVRFTPE